MTRTRNLLDRLAVAALGGVFVLVALLPDLIGTGNPGLGVPQVALLAVGLGILLAGVVFRIRPISALTTVLRRRGVGWPQLLLLGVSLFLTVVTADLLLRLVLRPTRVATRYGWTVPANAVTHASCEDTTGRYRQVTNQTFENGFKRWGNSQTGKRKMLVIGDSITQMNYVSNGEEWYSYLETQLACIELFVYGSGGYGSLQEYMVLDDYIDRIDPDLILWQFCSNDYANNFYDLDRLGYPYNNQWFRPYLEQGDIVYRLPLPYATLREYSPIADRLLLEYDHLVSKGATQEVYRRSRANLSVRELAREKLLEDEAYAVTLEIMQKVRKRAKDLPIYLFNGCERPTDREERICSATGITCLPGVAESALEKEAAGLEVRVPHDGHWNRLGNRILGETLVRYFASLKICDEPSGGQPAPR